MNLMALARDNLTRGSDRVRDARRAFSEGRLPDAMRFAPEGLELALKAALRSMAVEVPKRHDPAPALEAVERQLPEWFRSELPALRRLSFELAERRSLAMYGDERTGRPASELFEDASEVRRYLDQVDAAVALVHRLIPKERSPAKAVRAKAPGRPTPRRRTMGKRTPGP